MVEEPRCRLEKLRAKDADWPAGRFSVAAAAVGSADPSSESVERCVEYVTCFSWMLTYLRARMKS
jgi:hypothetical protein